MKLLLLFIVLPIVEMWLIFKLASLTSWGFTFLVVIVTGVIGTTMARRQGWKISRRIRKALNRGELPADALLDGLLLLVGGLLLITPGLLTDCAGFLLLIPFTRTLISNHIREILKKSIQQGTTHFTYQSSHMPPREDDVIDVEWEEEEDSPPDRPSLPR